MNEYIFGSLITLEATFDASATNAELRVRSPGQAVPTVYPLTGTNGTFTKDITGDAAGGWWYRFEVTGTPQGEVEGEFLVLPDRTDAPPVTDPADLRVLIPRARRAIIGPGVVGAPAQSEAELTDADVLGFIADATANAILLCNAFGYKLVVTSRDPYYQAPDGWATDRPLSADAETAVIAQGAIDFFFRRFQDMKVSETIKDEGQEWDWEKSAALVRDQLKMLAAVRDRALESLGLSNQAPDEYISFVAERDKLAAVWVEPWVAEIGAPTPFVWGGDISGHDSRFLGPGEAWW